MAKRSPKTVYASPDPRAKRTASPAVYDEPDVAPEPPPAKAGKDAGSSGRAPPRRGPRAEGAEPASAARRPRAKR